MHFAINLDFTQEHTKPIQEESGIEPHSLLQNREGDEESGSDGSANSADRDEVNVQIAAPTEEAEENDSDISDVEEMGYCDFSSSENRIMSLELACVKDDWIKNLYKKKEKVGFCFSLNQ